ncbi:hypothetical protein HYX11_04840, partial [Candidatus Woesearchaeota archaeon]|nr:hypothetical protein [Candidatus Woesearchaeota archaeon]
MRVNKKNFLMVSVVLMFSLMVYFTVANSILVKVSPTPNGLANLTNVSGTIIINMTINDETGWANFTNITIRWINNSGFYVRNITIFNDTVNDTVFNASIITTSLLDGVYNITIGQLSNATDVNNITNISWNAYFITVDNLVPEVLDASHMQGPLGWGLLTGVADEFFSTSPGNNILNVSINVTDLTSGVKNVTFNFTQMCQVENVAAEMLGGIWYANCTVNVSRNFAQYNITYTSCDYLGNCNNSLYRTIWLYNFTIPSGTEGVINFSSVITTNLSTKTNLGAVNYVLDIYVNGSTLPRVPWDGFKRAVLFNFTSLNFTSSTIGTKLAGLTTAIAINISGPQTYGLNRIYINSTFFSELNTTTNITLYELPFTSQPNITGDSDSAGGVKVLSWVGGTTTGNLTFSVTGFSGYNITDNVNPRLLVHSPIAHNFTSATVLFNFTFNGTGTEVDNSSINITLTGPNGAITFINYSNMTCTVSNVEWLLCNKSNVILADGFYNMTATVKDYGGTAGNTNTTTVLNFSVDMTAPYTRVSTINTRSNTSWTNSRILLINTTVTDDHISYWNVSVTHSNGSMLNSNRTTGFTLTNLFVNLSVAQDGNYTINLTAYDSLGYSNTTPLFYIYVDTVNPVTNSLGVSGVTSSEGRLTVNVTDVASGINYCNYSEVIGSGNLTLSSGLYTAILGGFSASTSYTVSVRCIDNVGNVVSNSTVITTEAATSSSSSSSGGGGGSTGTAGGVSNSVAGQYEKKIWTSINKDEKAVISVKDDKLGITGIEF